MQTKARPLHPQCWIKNGQVWVRCTAEDRAKHVEGGTARHEEAMRLGMRDYNGFTGDSLDTHIEGYAAEDVVCLARGRPRVRAKFREIDVGDFEVRLSRRHWYDLRLNPTPKDHADRRYLLVTGEKGLYCIRGWILGKDGMREEWWGEKAIPGRPCFFVPQSALTPFTPESPEW